MKKLALIILAAAMPSLLFAAESDSLENGFLHPPATARPWVYWFWNNGNVTSNGITADLEAMRRVGIGGVLIMDVVQPFAPPRGPAEFMNGNWRDLFEFSVQEAARLGLEINMANGPGWCGSSGPWITPGLSMQMLVSTNIMVEGPESFSATLPQPDTSHKLRHRFSNSPVKYHDFYHDIAVLAFPDAPNGEVSRGAVVDLTAALGTHGRLHWRVPPGRWVIQRIGCTTTGASTRPPVAGGNGLECDKLNAAAMDVQFTNMMGRLIARAGPLAGKSLVATHIDSWEVGSQNWTPKLREEFAKRRGYDPLPWLPCVTGVSRARRGNRTEAAHRFNLGSVALANRFRWDFEETLSELLAENYSGQLAKLAHQHGLRFTLEGYTLPFGDQFTYAARADEPMTEFWTGYKFNPAHNDTRTIGAASVAHVYGRAVVGAEAFTSGSGEQWKLTPADIKSLGDYEFSRGVNRFVIHRYAHQPYLNRWPGATMGPWGLHYERTETWWDMSRPWHEYLARCQFMLRQGKFVADLLYLRPERPNQTYFTPNPTPPDGYRYDEISAEALEQRVTVRGERLVLPDGMSYRLLVLPPQTAMTPALARKLKALVAAGATVMGPRPMTSPSLQDYPECDQTVAQIGNEVWGDCDGKKVTRHEFGKGRVVLGPPLAEVLAGLNTTPDFQSEPALNWIHRRLDGAEVYFVANPSAGGVEAKCQFRVTGMRPELWNPETGGIRPLAAWERTAGGVSVPLHFGPSGSVFVVFRRRAAAFDPVVSLTRNGQSIFAPTRPPKIRIEKAIYGVPGDARRTRDVRRKLQAMADRGVTAFKVAEMARGDDPAYGVVKTLDVEYTIDGRPARISGQDRDNIKLVPARATAEPAAELRCDAKGAVRIAARRPGDYELKTASGKKLRVNVASVPAPVKISGPWTLAFPPHWGAPRRITLDSLVSWSDSTNLGVKYFSGRATYTKTFDWHRDAAGGKTETWLDLGDVKVMARIKLNGQDLGILWKPPFRANVTGRLRPGPNKLEIRVANLWPNRMIGDAALPENKRFTWSSWEPFKPDSPLLKSGLLGPVRILTAVTSVVEMPTSLPRKTFWK